MNSFDYVGLLHLVFPQVVVVLTALLVLTVDLLVLRGSAHRRRALVSATIAVIGCAVAIAVVLHHTHAVNVLDGMIVVNPLAQHVQIALLVLTSIILLLFVDSDFSEHVSEFVALVLLATVGMMFLVATQNLLTIFLSLELLSLSLYVLTAFNKHSVVSAESALKYFLFGGISAAFMLFGFSLLYGWSNSANLVVIGQSIGSGAVDSLLIIALVMVIVGLGFKVAAVPFHFWAPDAYEGAPAPSAALIASSSKVASFFVFFQLMAIALVGAKGSGNPHHFAAGWIPVIAVVAALSMLLGNLVAITQTSVRRLLAYSAVAHSGYMLLGILAHTPGSLSATLFYVITYGLTVIGAFGVVALLEQHTGSDSIAAFAGFSRRAPLPALCMFVFLLSLAGIPPLAGFFAKFYLFTAVYHAAPGAIAVIILAIAMSAVSLYYYLKVLKSIYVAAPAVDASPIKASLLQQAVLCGLAIVILILGCAPNLLLRCL